jgi:GNAT superfamily N-acetyltransferase
VRHAFLVDVMVHPDFQKKGIGRTVVLREAGPIPESANCCTDRRRYVDQPI